MFLVTSMLSVLVVGSIAFLNGRESLRVAAENKLATIRELRSHELQNMFEELQRNIVLESRNMSARTAARELIDGWNGLEGLSLTGDQQEELDAYYANVVVPLADERTGQDYEADGIMPKSERARYLQYWYSRVNHTFDTAGYAETRAILDPGDGSSYSAAHAVHHSYFQQLVDSYDYLDVMVANLAGDIVYTADKGIDLGVNLHSGPYRNTLLAQAYDEVLRTGTVNAVLTTDFEDWGPSLGRPTLWVVSPIGDDHEIAGVMIGQVRNGAIDSVVTGDHLWKQQGFGETGEVYLAGRDGLMRSGSRALHEDPETYERKVIAAGTAPAIAEEIVRRQRTANRQPVDDAAVSNALRGETGFVRGPDYLSGDALSSYMPLRLEGLDWVLVARSSAAEAFAPAKAFTRALVLPTLVLMVVVCMVSMLLAQVFSRPLRRLARAVDRAAGGEAPVPVPARSADEIGQLGRAFNHLVAALGKTRDKLDTERSRTGSLLHTLMPAPLVEQYERGDATISESYENVAVVALSIGGLDAYTADLDGPAETELLNTINRGFEDAAQRAGVQVVHSARDGLLAAAGLNAARLDSVQRAVEFARAVAEVVDRRGRGSDGDLTVRVGIDVGQVTSGLVGRAELAHDLWGAPVTVVNQLRADTALPPGVYVSEAVRLRLEGTRRFEPAGPGEPPAAWRVLP